MLTVGEGQVDPANLVTFGLLSLPLDYRHLR